MKTVYTQAITINEQRYTLDDLHKAAGCALRHRERKTGARLNLTYTTIDDLVSCMWLLMVEQGYTLPRAADEATRQALRQQKRHTHFDIPITAQAPQTDAEALADAPPLLSSLFAGYTLTEIATAQGRSVSAVWRAVQREKQEFVACY